MALDEVWEPNFHLVAEELLGGDREDLIDFFERLKMLASSLITKAETYELLGLAHEAEDHEPSDQVQAGVEAECTGLCHDCGHTWECKAQDTGEGVVDAHSPGHALLTVNCGEDLGAVLESDRSFAERVHDGEEVHKSAMLVSFAGLTLDAITTYSTTGPSRAPWLAVSGTSSERPAASKNIAIRGKVCGFSQSC